MFHADKRARVAQSFRHTIAFSAAATLPQLALAQASPFQTGADSLVTNLIALATPIAILAVMVLAIVAMTGRISWGWPIGALVGIGVIFGAPQLVQWARGVTYGTVRHEEEFQLSRYSFELADPDLYRELFERFMKEGQAVLGMGERTALAAYDFALKSSHAFNVLDARGAISVSQRAGMILSIRKLACDVAAKYLKETSPGTDNDATEAQRTPRTDDEKRAENPKKGKKGATNA